MVLEEISQLIEDCDSKRETLSNYRDDINESQKQLLKIALKRLEKDDLTDLEHYQNQFHIQLINIHDLRHELRACQHRLKTEGQLHDGMSSDTIDHHKSLSVDYDSLESILKDLQVEFDEFVAKTL